MDSCIADPVRDCHGAAKTLNTCARQKCEMAVRASKRHNLCTARKSDESVLKCPGRSHSRVGRRLEYETFVWQGERASQNECQTFAAS